MEIKKCSRCGEEKPLEDFVKCAKAPDGRAAQCKKCHYEHYIKGKRKQIEIAFAPKVDDSTLKELEEHHLADIPARLLVHELRRRGYRGELEKVTIQKL